MLAELDIEIDGPDEAGPERRCIASGERRPKETMLRFVVGPDGDLVPDVEERLPGRGLWLTASPASLERAIRRNLFARAARRPVRIDADLPARLERLLVERMVTLISLARRAGQAVAGFEKVRAAIGDGAVAVLLAARDGSRDGRDKLERLWHRGPAVAVLDADELGRCFGRPHAVHAVIAPGGLAKRISVAARRLSPFRADDVTDITPEGVDGDK